MLNFYKWCKNIGLTLFSSKYFGLPNRRTDPNKRTGTKNIPKRINAQTQISAQGCKTVITETNVKSVLAEVRTALLFNGEK